MSGKVEEIMGGTIEQIRKMVDSDTIVGKPITTQDGTTIIPISKVTYGFGSGGSDFSSKKDPDKEMFGGGGGAGISIIPVAFLSVHKGEVRAIQIEPSYTSVDRIIDLAPGLIDKVAGYFKKDKNEKKSSAAEKQEIDEIVKNIKEENK